MVITGCKVFLVFIMKEKNFNHVRAEILIPAETDTHSSLIIKASNNIISLTALFFVQRID